MDANLRREPPTIVVGFPTNAVLARKPRFPRDDENCRSISAVRRTQSSRFCAVPVFDEVASTERNLGHSTNSPATDFADSVSVGHRLPSGSGNNSFKKSIFTSVLVAVALRIEWF